MSVFCSNAEELEQKLIDRYKKYEQFGNDLRILISIDIIKMVTLSKHLGQTVFEDLILTKQNDLKCDLFTQSGMLHCGEYDEYSWYWIVTEFPI